jgi:hypothetical protein
MFHRVAALAAGVLLVASQLAAAQNTALYQLQERCGKSAAEVFAKEYANGTSARVGDSEIYFGYEAHYNAKLNKCFYLEKTQSYDFNKKSVTSGFRLYDIHENKEIGGFGGVHPALGVVDCQVNGERCRSEDEWRALAKPYLEE